MKYLAKLRKVPIARCGFLTEKCNFCSKQAVLDTPSKRGPFCYVCDDHITQYARADWVTSARRIMPLPEEPMRVQKNNRGDE